MKRVLFISIIFFSLSFPKPRVEAGLKISRFNISDWYSVDTGYFNFTVFYEPYWGISGELLFGFVENLYLRLELGEFRAYKKFGRGIGLNLFSNLDADFIYILPIGRMVSPSIYCGVNYQRYFGKPDRDVRGYAPTYEFRLGTGINYRQGKRMKVFLEGQFVTKYQIYEREIGSTQKIYKTTKIILGLPRLNLGVRFSL